MVSNWVHTRLHPSRAHLLRVVLVAAKAVVAVRSSPALSVLLTYLLYMCACVCLYLWVVVQLPSDWLCVCMCVCVSLSGCAVAQWLVVCVHVCLCISEWLWCCPVIGCVIVRMQVYVNNRRLIWRCRNLTKFSAFRQVHHLLMLLGGLFIVKQTVVIMILMINFLVHLCK